MTTSDYHRRIVQYYKETENAYKDSWDLANSLSIHYGYWDNTVDSFPRSLQRMNEVMSEAAAIRGGEYVLDAGCGVGGSSFFLAEKFNCKVTGISLSERQVEKGNAMAGQKKLEKLVDFRVMDYCATDFPTGQFDIVWGCESICYADNKEQFIKEALRILKPGGRLVIADGFVTDYRNNEHPFIRKWLDGWQVNYLETMERFSQFMNAAGFSAIQVREISAETLRSARRLYKFYFLASLYLAWRKISFSKPPTEMQKKNIQACKYQWLGRKKGLWQYGLIVGSKFEK